MREVIAVCRSTKRERDRVARVLDRYFWRIGDRTWRGKATNACLDRVSREIRQKAKRNTAVVIHEIRSAHESRVPIVRIGAARAFSDAGIAPVSARPSVARVNHHPSGSSTVVRVAALFHDLGKATRLFQDKLRRALKGAAAKGDPVRHELYSAAIWDHLFGKAPDEELPARLADLTPECIDKACDEARGTLADLVDEKDQPMQFAFLEREGSLAHAIGALILTHHRLPEGDSDLVTMLARRHVNPSSGARDGLRDALCIAPGVPFWHEDWWQRALSREAASLKPGTALMGLDVFLRAALMMGDHLGSHQKRMSGDCPDHLANTMRDESTGKPCPADSLSQHVRRVHAAARHGVDLLERHANGFPALDENAASMPVDIAFPVTSNDDRFRWQEEAARTARALCGEHEGGFFACLMAGTGTGKTRGAPTILACAAFGDKRPERRSLRMSLGLGLRVLATQSADEYVDDLGFGARDVSVLVGQVPLKFARGEDQGEDDSGSESLIDLPSWLKVEMARGKVPESGEAGEDAWLRTLSLDTGRGIPAFCEKVLEAAGKRAPSGRRLLEAPVMVGTIDHLMGVASPLNSRFLLPSLRVATSDLVLDEIDQYGGEDIAAIARLVHQSGTAGRRVVIMSATLTGDVSRVLHAAYQAGWTRFAKASGTADHVNLLVTGDAPGSCRTNAGGEDFQEVFVSSSAATLKALSVAPAVRRAEILPPCENWEGLIEQVSESCHRLHDANHVGIDDFRVSFGVVRMTRISHVAALATQLPSGPMNGRLRLVACLHSRFPRLHRGWIETRLKRALTRKGSDSDAGLAKLCRDEKLLERAKAAGVASIEIVLVTSPVIETGNDLDFDWAILDPISTRSVIQAAGRVRRHRPATGSEPNVLILGRSPIAMQGAGKLAMPGVESKPDDDTRVSRESLHDDSGKRLFQELAGDVDFSIINASQMLRHDVRFPLRDKELALLRKFISIDEGMPLGEYLGSLNARMTCTMARRRKFRRSTTRDVLFKMVGKNFEAAEWYRDLAAGTRDSCLQEAEINFPKPGQSVHAEGRLFRDYTASAWNDLDRRREPTEKDVGDLMSVEIPDYGNEIEPAVAYDEFSGFTRGVFDDLFKPFGKSKQYQ